MPIKVFNIILTKATPKFISTTNIKFSKVEVGQLVPGHYAVAFVTGTIPECVRYSPDSAVPLEEGMGEMGTRGQGDKGTRRQGDGEITNYQLPITNYQLPITNAQLITPNS